MNLNIFLFVYTTVFILLGLHACRFTKVCIAMTRATAFWYYFLCISSAVYFRNISRAYLCRRILERSYVIVALNINKAFNSKGYLYVLSTSLRNSWDTVIQNDNWRTPAKKTWQKISLLANCYRKSVFLFVLSIYPLLQKYNFTSFPILVYNFYIWSIISEHQLQSCWVGEIFIWNSSE